MHLDPFSPACALPPTYEPLSSNSCLLVRSGAIAEHSPIGALAHARPQSVATGFCPDCGATVFWTTEGWPDSIAVAIGAFADPSFPQPTVSVYESRRYPWLFLPD